MTIFLRFFALGLVVCLGACSTSSPRVVNASVRQGMSGAQLVSAFGKPIRVEHRSDGREDWFYNFGTQQQESRPVSESMVSETERSYSVGYESSTTTTMRAAPIHLSAGGRVMGPIPAGSVVVQ